MHKKLIGGATYYYTTHRCDDGRHRTFYLGKDFEIAKTREREILSKQSGLNSSINPQKLLYLPLLILCGLGLLLLSGQITGSFSYEPSAIEFDINESWNLSETLIRINVSNETMEFGVLWLIDNGKIIFDTSSLERNSSEGFYVDLIVSGELVNSKYVDVAEEATDLEVLKAEVEERLGAEKNVNVASVEKEGEKYKITVDLNTEGKGTVILRVGNVSDVRRVQVTRLEENVVQL